MADRVVKVKLVGDISDYTASLAKAAAQTRGLGTDVEKAVDRDVAPAMRRSGEKSGGLLARGINNGLVRNSPLIVAGVSAALAAGAPVLLAAASTLFAGVGAIAAAQTVEVREAWTDLGHEIRDSAVEDASILVPVYVGMADKIGAAFQRMRPEIRDAFTAAGPQIDQFTDSITQAAENALPGLVRAVERGGPVVEGLGSLMESVGTGISDLFDAMSDDNADAAGHALEAIGDALEEALPLLGELLGTGSELASIVLPPLADALGLVNDVAQALGPVLPAIVTGFAAMKVAQAATGWVKGLGGSLAGVAQNLAFASYGTSGFAGTAGKLSTASSGMATSLTNVASGAAKASFALPALGIVIAGIADTHSKATTEEDKWAQAILAGGEAASAAYQEYQSGTHWGQSIDEATGLASSWDEAKEKADQLRDSMSPVEQAQLDLSTAVERYGAASPQAAAAADVLTGAQEDQADANGELELAIDGVTMAMIKQADQAMAGIDSSFAYRHSIDQLEDAQIALSDAMANGTVEDQQRAMLALEEQNYRTALSYGQQQADLSGLSSDSAEYARIIQDQTLVKLYELQAAAGPEMAAAIGQQIASLEANGVAITATADFVSGLTGQVGGLTDKIRAVPGYKGVTIDAPTADQKRRIEELGYKVVTLPDGSIYVTADTWEATREIAALTATRTMTVVAKMVGGGFGFATGGPIPPIKAAGGRIVGPGGPTEDKVPAVGPGGRPWALSNGEWVIKASSASRYGPAAMAAVNAGTAVISGREVSGGASGAGGANIDALASKIASILLSRPTVGSITTQRDETGFELAERLAFLARG